jgi:hypothetical protein
MTSTIDVARTPRVELAGAELEFLTGTGEIALLFHGARASVEAPMLLTDGIVEAWADDDWLCLIGVRSPEVIVAVPRERRIESVGQLERLDLGGAYDPGGLHRVEFNPLEGGDLLIIHEFGAARISPTDGLVWRRAHHDLTAHLEGVRSDRVQFVAESGSFAYDLRDGRDVRV